MPKLCGHIWSLCDRRSGKGRSNPHVCDKPPGHRGAHVCAACKERG